MPLDREHTLSWIGLSSLAGVGRATFRSLVRSFGSADRVLSAPPDELRERGGLSEKIIGEMDSFPWRAGGRGTGKGGPGRGRHPHRR